MNNNNDDHDELVTTTRQISSAATPRHVSFHHSVDIIDDDMTGRESVNGPPVLIETLHESDEMMSFTELTETSDPYDYYYETPQPLAGPFYSEPLHHFGEQSMSLSDLYNRSDDDIVAEDVPAAVLPPVHNQSDLDTSMDNNDDDDDNDDDDSDDDDDDDDSATNEPDSSGSMWLRLVAALVAISGAVGFVVHWLLSRDKPVIDHDDVIAVSTTVVDKGFMIPMADGGTTYITYVFIIVF
jgi:hypothetical protein